MEITVITTQGDIVYSELFDQLKNSDMNSKELLVVNAKEVLNSKKLHSAIIFDITGPLARPILIKQIIDQANEERIIPILVLMSKREQGMIESLSGIDDFALTPFDYDEIVFRMRILKNRYKLSGDKKNILQTGDLIIDTSRYEVWVGQRQVSLTYKEYELLKLLVSEPGRVFTRDILLDQVWGYNYFGGTRTVDVHIRRLRGKLDDPKHSFVETVRNVGYRIKNDEERSNSALIRKKSSLRDLNGEGD